MPAVITGNAANALPMIAVNSAMPTVYVATTTNGVSSGIHRCKIPATIGPTPASANIAPSAASICGSTAAQLTASISRRASTIGAVSGGRSITTPTMNATTVAMPSEIERDLLRIDERRTADVDVLERERAEQRDRRNRQRGNEQPVPPARGARFSLGARRRLGRRAAELADRHHERPSR